MRFKQLGKTWLNSSVCGFGTYRVQNNEQHALALEKALKNGINLIDTSTNYSDGESEILVGKVIKKLVSEGAIKREDIILVSKAGYIQGQSLNVIFQKEQMGMGYKGIVKCSQEMWHCFDPEFIKDQITASLKRTAQEYIDVYLIHNPEYFLIYVYIDDINELRSLYYKRLELAFEQLEKEVQNGRIKSYGVSSNTFGYNTLAKEFTSLEKLIEIADSISPHNHFGVIQLPLNLIERGAAATKNQQNNSLSVLELAKKSNIGVLTNRPINAVVDNNLFKLSEIECKGDTNEIELKEYMQNLMELEKYIRDKVLRKLKRQDYDPMVDCLSISEDLLKNFGTYRTLESLAFDRDRLFIARMKFAVKRLLENLKLKEEAVENLKKYDKSIEQLFELYESFIASGINEKRNPIIEQINKFLSEKAVDLTLAQKAVLANISLDEVSCCLVGMTSVKYVDDVLEIVDFDKELKIAEFYSA
ncbi:MAG: aldo/keto reductase [Ignavibacteria bacterium]|jgi:aryl-alcohol dehydrogenase-like predicted oxidoreductase